MAALVSKQSLEVDVAYHGFCFQESDDFAVPVPFADGFVQDRFLNGHERRIDLYSAGHTHTAQVTVEVWNAAPAPAPSTGWECDARAEIETTSGELAIWAMTLGRADEVVHLADEGGWWNVRVRCTGREAVRRVTEAGEDAEGIERYVIQFWPKGR
ncbi:hypothetical protein [Streptomyces pinistramenti]|uniref:hypothetical protein n=1 Tax=Streptomyces pinistramenti TaxID=2884812 RepID=UPI001D06CEBC|nr:hypothetical protein [Streptomyces pinistramenti]MCB5905896.1 hypothetical protein [Streptomyces pinistramenti]